MDPITITIGGISGILGLIIFIVTLVSIVNNPNHGAFGKFLWILVALFLSLLGSLLWLIFGRGRVSKR
jgi:Phospholipase_D-nuclease N-terminal